MTTAIVTKRCNACWIEKSLDNFTRDSKCKLGVTTRCKQCRRLGRTSMNAAQTEFLTSQNKAKCHVCKQIKNHSEFTADSRRVTGVSSRCKICHVIKGVEHNRKKKTGVTPSEYKELLIKQNGLCAICNKPDQRKELSADHCHASGTKRGLLCSNCNLLLGNAKDDIETLKSAILYLGGEL